MNDLEARLQDERAAKERWQAQAIRVEEENKVLRLRLEGALGGLTRAAAYMRERARDVHAEWQVAAAAVEHESQQWGPHPTHAGEAWTESYLETAHARLLAEQVKR